MFAWSMRTTTVSVSDYIFQSKNKQKKKKGNMAKEDIFYRLNNLTPN